MREVACYEPGVLISIPAPDPVERYLQASRAGNTHRAYISSFGQFVAWCAELQLCPLPAEPEVIARYLSCQAGRLKSATLALHLAAISKAHKAAGLASPITDN